MSALDHTNSSLFGVQGRAHFSPAAMFARRAAAGVVVFTLLFFVSANARAAQPVSVQGSETGSVFVSETEPPASCDGDLCQGPLPPAPGPLVPGSAVGGPESSHPEVADQHPQAEKHSKHKRGNSKKKLKRSKKKHKQGGRK
jgi:hypothetical protein